MEKGGHLMIHDGHINVEHSSRDDVVLLVDDHEPVRKILAKILRRSGYRVLEASDGVDGLRMFESHRGPKISLVITDICMPNKSGIAMARDLIQICPAQPILFMTAYPLDLLEEWDMIDPTYVLLEKPIMPARLIEVVRGLICGPVSNHQVEPTFSTFHRNVTAEQNLQ
jgi:two-component system, cell cycle sensor histidine kinase and response regulator CckA